jgi:Lon protease-like protein
MDRKRPVFPLNSVLFPGGLLPLRIFEPRYLDMISACLKNDTGFVVTLIKAGRETGIAAEHYMIGTLAKIIDWKQYPDGLLGITVKGQDKVKILSQEVQQNQLILGNLEVLPTEPHSDIPSEFEQINRLLKRILVELGSSYPVEEQKYTDAGWVAGRLVELLPLELAQKQTLLELEDPLSRLFQLRDYLLNLELL